jgi:hypothetical protein
MSDQQKGPQKPLKPEPPPERYAPSPSLPGNPKVPWPGLPKNSLPGNPSVRWPGIPQNPAAPRQEPQ